jgi:hypothetical protein
MTYYPAQFIRIQRSFVIGSLLLWFAAEAGTLLVYNNNDTGAGSLRYAVQNNAAQGGGNTIVFSNTVTGAISLASGELLITNNVTIAGPGAHVLALSAGVNSRIFHITNCTAAISGLSLTNGKATAFSGGGAVYLNSGALTLSGCILSKNIAVSSGLGLGGGIYATTSSLVLSNCTVGANSASQGAGLEFDNGGTLRVINCGFFANNSSGSGAGMYLSGGGSASLTNVSFFQNTAPGLGDTGGAIYNGATLTLCSCTISGNLAGSFGGGIENLGTATIFNTIVAGNAAQTADFDCGGTFISRGFNLIGQADTSSGWGALGDQIGTRVSPINPSLGPLQDNGGPTLTMAPLPGSPAIDQGNSFGLTFDQRGRTRPWTNNPALPFLGDGADIGAVELAPLIVGSTSDSGAGSLRQAILDASPVASDSIIFSPGVAGTIALSSGQLAIGKGLSITGPGAPGITVSGNNASRVFDITGGSVSISDLTIANGNAGSPGGGGIFVEYGGALSLSNSTVAFNTTSDSGGGLANNGIATVINCTFYGNQAGSGGGLYNFAPTDSTGQLNLFNSTVVSNISVGAGGQGGGFLNYTAAFRHSVATIRSSIIADNVAGPAEPNQPDVIGAFISQGYNLIGNTNGSSGFTNTADRAGLDPMLGPLANNGGPTPTLLLLPSSPAINQGNSFGLTTDQRGRPRPFIVPSIPNAPGGDGSDVGAVELGLFIVNNTNDNGSGSLRQAILDASPVVGDLIGFGSNVIGTIILTNGQLAISKGLSITGPGAPGITVSGNNASRVFDITGGPVYLFNLTIANGNAGSPGGGGIFSETASSLVLSNCTLSGNVTSDSGGGIANNGSVWAYNCTFSGNQGRNGGGIYTYAGPVVLRHCTVVSNTATGRSDSAGGGIFNYSPVAGTSNNLSGTLIAGNTAATHDDVIGVFTSAGYNLIGKIDYSTPASGGAAFVSTSGLTNNVNQDLVGSLAAPTNAMVGPLRDNGGQTFTHGLLPGSPAIDNGISDGLLTDQRGAPRPFPFYSLTSAPGDGSDIGAFELGRPLLKITLLAPNAVVSWPACYGDFALEAAPALAPPNQWNAVSNLPAIVGAQFDVTNSVATGNQFFRLRGN